MRNTFIATLRQFFLLFFLLTLAIDTIEAKISPFNPKQLLKDHHHKQLKKELAPVTVAIIDTGIDFSQPFLKNNIGVVQGEVSIKNFGFDFSSEKNEKTEKIPNTTPFDELGHGTHIAGIIKGIAPNVKFLVIKYYNSKATGIENLKSAIAAFRVAVTSNVDIINFSGGGPGFSADEQEVLKEAQKRDILVVVAAGNRKKNIDDENDRFYPASYGLSNLITVSAVDKNFSPLPTSNWGKHSVDVSAPGEKIPSISLSGQIITMSGTSQATAYVTGVAALLKEHYPRIGASTLKQIIINSTSKVDKLKEICNSGGVVNVKNAMVYGQYLSTTQNQTVAPNTASTL